MRGYDVVICGAGIGGLALAAGLGRAGLTVLLAERRRADSPVHKGEFLQPRALQILDSWDLLPAIRAGGAVLIEAAETRDADGEFLGELDYRRLPSRFNHGLVQYYEDLKNTLYDHAAGLVEIRRGAKVIELLRSASGRVGGVRLQAGDGDVEDIRARLTAGADGRLSLVRRQAGIDLRFKEYDHEMMSLDLPRAELAPRVVAYLTRDGLRALYPMPGGTARLYVQIRPGEFGAIKRQDPAVWRDRLLAGAPGLAHLRSSFPPGFGSAQVQRAWRYCAGQWTRPGVALLGDAAHSVHPSAGQGMNAAIHDAWSLAEAITGSTSDIEAIDAAISGYERQRKRQFAHMARICNRMAVFCTSTSPLVRRVATHMGRRNRANRRLQHMIAYNVSGLGEQRFTVLDRMYQLGILRDPRAAEAGG